MPEKSKINLLPKTEFENSNAGKLLNWVVTVGRWIVVLTEFIVICAFLSRFYFDTELSNLFDSLRQKKTMVDSALAFESEFVETQEKLKIIKGLLANEKKPSTLITRISQLLPLDVSLTAIQIDQESLRISGFSLSEQGVRTLIKQINHQPDFSQVSLGSISQKENSLGISFEISAIVKK